MAIHVLLFTRLSFFIIEGGEIWSSLFSSRVSVKLQLNPSLLSRYYLLDSNGIKVEISALFFLLIFHILLCIFFIFLILSIYNIFKSQLFISHQNLQTKIIWIFTPNNPLAIPHQNFSILVIFQPISLFWPFMPFNRYALRPSLYTKKKKKKKRLTSFHMLYLLI